MKNDKGCFPIKENEEFVKVEGCDFVVCGKNFKIALKLLLSKFDLLET